MRTFIFLLYVLYYFIIAWPLSLRARYYQKRDADKFQAYIKKEIQRCAAGCLAISGADVEFEGIENITGETTVFVSNHQSDFDIAFMLGYLDKPYGILAKKEAEKVPVFSIWMRLFGCVFVDRQNPREASRTLSKVVETLKSGKSMIVFPEGTRSKSAEVGEFKSGAFKTAFKSGVSVTPIGIDGTYRLFEGNGYHVKPAKIRMKIFPPIQTTGIEREQQKAFGEDVRAMIKDWVDLK